MVFGGLTPTGLSQLSGEAGTGAQQATLYAMDQFLGVVTDPFVAGRSVAVGGDGDPDTNPGGLAYAEDGGGPSKRDADATLSKASPDQPGEQRWRAWAAAYAMRLVSISLRAMAIDASATSRSPSVGR